MSPQSVLSHMSLQAAVQTPFADEGHRVPDIGAFIPYEEVSGCVRDHLATVAVKEQLVGLHCMLIIDEQCSVSNIPGSSGQICG